MSILKITSASCICILILFVLLIPASALPVETNILDIEKLSNGIVKKELAMLKLGNQFLLEREHYDKFKPWREFAYNSAAAGTIHSGIIMQTINGWHGYEDLRKINRRLGKAGGSLLVAGGGITIGGAFIETAIDFFRGRKLKRDGMDSKSVLKRFIELRKDIDLLLAQREETISRASKLTDYQRKLLAAEGIVLADVCELSTRAFADSFIKVKQGLWQRETAKILAVESAADSSFLGSLNSFLAFTDHRPRQMGVAGIGFLIGGTSVMSTPYILKLAGAYGAHRARAHISKALGEVQIKTFDKLRIDMAQLSTIIKMADYSELQMLTALNARQSIYEAHQLLLFDEPFSSDAKKKEERRQFKERVIFSTLVGGSNFARGIISINSGYRYYRSPKKFNELNAIASTTYTAGTGVWIIDLLQQRTRAELNARKLKLTNAAPESKLQTRLDAIDNLENAIRFY